MPDDSTKTVRPMRPPQENVPQAKQERDALLQVVRGYVSHNRPVPPLSLEELRTHTAAVIEEAKLHEKYSDFATVLVNNEVWRERVAAIPFEKRLLLLPKCLRDAEKCQADFDEIGLLCENCGQCVISEFKSQAEQLGYAVLIAEGSPVVMSLIETGKIEAIVGVSCLSVLERVFPYMEAGAVPGVAIPLLRDGCANTFVDMDWVWEAIYQTTDDASRRLNLDELRNRVTEWFSYESLREVFALHENETERLALDWIARAGKRWRPFLTACAYEALTDSNNSVSEDVLKKTAIAVECFHKASLIHDDIEDGDEKRYGQQTLHEELGVPIALNIGDLLLGEGYRLLIELNVPDNVKTKLLDMAARGHRTLCLGQGTELMWVKNPKPLEVEEILKIFRLKTSPAFEVALNLGAILAGADSQIVNVHRSYSESLGMAYQIRDDIEDLRSPDKEKFLNSRSPSIIHALAYKEAKGAEKTSLESIWSQTDSKLAASDVEQMIASLGIETIALRLMESYKYQAIGCLIPLKNTNLKSLLRRVLSKIFDDIEVMGCCNDTETRHAKGRKQGQQPSQ